MPRVPLDIEIRNRTGAVVPSTRLYIYDRGTTNQVSVYTADTGGSVITQPLLSDVEGRFPDSWVEAGAYDRYSPDDTVQPTQPWEAVAGRALVRVAYDVREWGSFVNGTDVSGILQDAIDDTSVGGVGNPAEIILPAGDDYGIDAATVELRSNVHLRGAGKRITKFKAGSGSVNCFHIYDDDNVTISDMSISVDGFESTAIRCDSLCSNICLEHVELMDGEVLALFTTVETLTLYDLGLFRASMDGAGNYGVGLWIFKGCTDVNGFWIYGDDFDHGAIVVDAGTSDALGVVNDGGHLSHLNIRNAAKGVPGSAIMLEGAKRYTISDYLIDGAGSAAMPSNAGVGLTRDQANIGPDYNVLSNGEIKNTWGPSLYLGPGQGNEVNGLTARSMGLGGATVGFAVMFGNSAAADDLCWDNHVRGVQAYADGGTLTSGARFGDGGGTVRRNTIQFDRIDAGVPLRSNHASAVVEGTNRAIPPLGLYDSRRLLPGVLAPQLPDGLPQAASNLAAIASTAYVGRFVLDEDLTVALIGFVVSTAAGSDDPVDVGIYDGTLATKIASAGATTGKLNSTGLKTITLAATLYAGVVYYAAISYGTIGTTAASVQAVQFNITNNASVFGATVPNLLVGVKGGSVHPLPASLASGYGPVVNGPILAVRSS